MKKHIKNITLAAAIISGSLFSCNSDSKESESIETEPIAFTKEGELYVLQAEGDTIQKLDIEFAITAYERQKGLMDRESMEDNQAMLFIFEDEAQRSFYMKNTYIALDIAYYASDSTLVSIQKDAKPLDETSLPSDGPAQFVLEVNAGLTDDWNLEPGDKITWTQDD